MLCAGVALRAVADDGDSFALQYAHVGVFVIENFHIFSFLRLK